MSRKKRKTAKQPAAKQPEVREELDRRPQTVLPSRALLQNAIAEHKAEITSLHDKLSGLQKEYEGRSTEQDYVIRSLRTDLEHALANVVTKVELVCEFCEHQFDAALGRHSCPNCLGGDLGTPQLVGFLAIRPVASRYQMMTFAVIPTFGVEGPEQGLKNVLAGAVKWIGFRVLLAGDQVRLEPYKP